MVQDIRNDDPARMLSYLESIISDCKAIMAWFDSIYVSFILRVSNLLAHTLALIHLDWLL